jgi:hypothetical protein
MDSSIGAAGRGKRDVRRAQPRKFFAESPTTPSPRSAQKKKGPRRNNEDSGDLFPARQILAEKTEDRKVFYLIDWEGVDSKTGLPYTPTWVFHKSPTMSIQIADMRNSLATGWGRYICPPCSVAEQKRGACHGGQPRSSHARLHPRKSTCTLCETPESCAKL